MTYARVRGTPKAVPVRTYGASETLSGSPTGSLCVSNPDKACCSTRVLMPTRVLVPLTLYTLYNMNTITCSRSVVCAPRALNVRFADR